MVEFPEIGETYYDSAYGGKVRVTKVQWGLTDESGGPSMWRAEVEARALTLTETGVMESAFVYASPVNLFESKHDYILRSTPIVDVGRRSTSDASMKAAGDHLLYLIEAQELYSSDDINSAVVSEARRRYEAATTGDNRRSAKLIKPEPVRKLVLDKDI